MQKLIMARRLCLAGILVIGTGFMLVCSAQVHAEYLGFPTGRSAKISALPSSSIEAGFVTGDVGFASYQSFGARFNLRTSSTFMVYVDLSQAEVGDADGLAFGAGFFYQIPGITKNSDFAAKVSYHTATLKESDPGFGRDDEYDANVLSIEGVFSGQEIGESDLRWYTNFGVHKFDFDTGYDESELGFGAGVFTDTSFGEFYAGIDLIDELTFGLGVRYHLQ